MVSKPSVLNRNFLLLTFANFGIVLNYMVLIPSTTAISIDIFNDTSAIAGITTSSFIVGAFMVRFGLGPLLAKIGYKAGLIGGAFANLALTAAYFLAPSALLLIPIRFLHGAVFAVSTTTGSAVASLLLPPEQSGRAMGYYSLSATLGAAFGPMLAMLFIGGNVHYSAVAVAVAASAFSCLLAFFVRTEPHASNKSLSTQSKIVEADSSEAKSIWSKIFDFPTMWIAGIMALIYACYSAIMSFLPEYSKFTDQGATLSLFFLIFGIMVIASRPLVAKLFDAGHSKKLLLGGISVMILACVLYSLVNSPFTVIIAAALVGLGTGCVQSTTLSLAMKQAATTQKAVASSTYYFMSDIGIGLAPVFVGGLIPVLGLRGIYFATAGICVLALLLVWWFNKLGKVMFG